MQNIKALGLVVSDKKIFEVCILKIYFSSCDLVMQCTGTILTTLVKGHPRMIAVQFHEDWPRSLGGEVV